MPALAPGAQDTSDRNCGRSQLGYEFTLAGGCFHAVSRRQHSVALDTATAELFAASTAASDLINVTGVLRFISFGVLCNDDTPVPIWCDNEICVMVSKGESAEKRVAYAARRCRFLQELTYFNFSKLYKISGLVNPADLLTKYLAKDKWLEYATVLYNVPPGSLRMQKAAYS